MPDFKAKILVIDDEKVVCISCKRILEEEGHTVEYVLNGTEGIQRAIDGDYELVLLDLQMPDMSGIEVLEAIRAQRRDISIVIITGYATIQTSIEAIKKGAFDYIPKPFTPEELAIAVKQALENRQLKTENEFLKSELSKATVASGLICRSDTMSEITKQIHKIAPTDFSVLIYGESGTGKELIAQEIHRSSHRAQQQFVAVDLSAVSPNLLESELFGHVRGAFTGATGSRPGYFSLANGGTLFLDEVSNISLELQGKLLRVLESRRIRPVGGDNDQEIDIRLVAATNRDLTQMVEEGSFREDLYYRLNVIPLILPPLRERPTDIPLLAAHFMKEAKKKDSASRIRGISTEAMAKLMSYKWPGNVRELKNIIQRLVAITDGELIGVDHLPPEIDGTANTIPIDSKEAPRNVEELKEAKRRLREMVYESVERQFVINSLENANWNVSKAAQNTGMQRTNFHALMRKYGIKVRDRD